MNFTLHFSCDDLRPTGMFKARKDFEGLRAFGIVGIRRRVANCSVAIDDECGGNGKLGPDFLGKLFLCGHIEDYYERGMSFSCR